MTTHEGVKLRMILRKPTSLMSSVACWRGCASRSSLLDSRIADMLVPAASGSTGDTWFGLCKYMGSSSSKCCWQWRLSPGHVEADIFGILELCVKLKLWKMRDVINKHRGSPVLMDRPNAGEPQLPCIRPERRALRHVPAQVPTSVPDRSRVKG